MGQETQNNVAQTVNTDSAKVPQNSESREQAVGRCCREMLKEIRDVTYLCSDKQVLESLK